MNNLTVPILILILVLASVLAITISESASALSKQCKSYMRCITYDPDLQVCLEYGWVEECNAVWSPQPEV